MLTTATIETVCGTLERITGGAGHVLDLTEEYIAQAVTRDTTRLIGAEKAAKLGRKIARLEKAGLAYGFEDAIMDVLDPDPK
jgi:hypothetical protein